LVSANQHSSDFRPVSRVANITADYKQLRFISSEKAREWMRAAVSKSASFHHKKSGKKKENSLTYYRI